MTGEPVVERGWTLSPILATLTVLTVPSLAYLRTPVWALDRDLTAQALGSALVFAVSWLAAGALAVAPFRRWVVAVLLLLVGVGVLYLAFGLQPQWQYSRALTGVSLGLSVIAAGMLALPRWRGGSLALLACAAGTSAIWLAIDVAKGPTPPPPAPTSRTIAAGAYTLAWQSHRVVEGGTARWGGGITPLGDRFVAMTGGGGLYELVPDPSGPRHRRLPLPSPLDVTAFDRDAPADVNRNWFRAHDVIARRTAAGWEVFASHHAWNGPSRCVAVVVSRLRVDERMNAVGDWVPIFTAKPCLPVGGSHRGVPFAGLEAGGRMAWLPDGRLLLTLGDHQFDGVNRQVAAAQDAAYDYGKTLVVDVDAGTATRFTLGHRNPQGLYLDADGTVWSTEHGPQGGDELNRLEPFKNYGWPYVTFGTDYGTTVWPPSALAPKDVAFTPPLHAWVPSLGISNLIRLTSPKLPQWNGHFLIATLRAQTLLRVVVDRDRVTLIEPIPVERRVRDLVQTPEGDVWLWCDEGDLVVLAPSMKDEQSQQALGQCMGCHIVDRDRRSGGLGPNLFDVVDRPVASNETYTSYSPALKQLGGTWTGERLDAFLADPARFAPGTTMSYAVASPQQRALIIAALRSKRTE